MKYVEQVLQPGESLTYATTLHWLVYLRALVFFVLAVVCLIFAGKVDAGGVDTALKIAAALLCVLGILSARTHWCGAPRLSLPSPTGG